MRIYHSVIDQIYLTIKYIFLCVSLDTTGDYFIPLCVNSSHCYETVSVFLDVRIKRGPFKTGIRLCFISAGARFARMPLDNIYV